MLPIWNSVAGVMETAPGARDILPATALMLGLAIVRLTLSETAVKPSSSRFAPS